MPRAFNPEAERNVFALPPLTRQQIRGLMSDLACDAREVIIRAVAELWQREIGEPDRDVLAELDELKQRIAALEATGELAGKG